MTSYPAGLVGPHFQKLTLPIDGSDSGSYADEIVPPRLATYTSQYCQLASDAKSVFMRAYHGGATTPGSRNSRSEWRETNTNGSLAKWDGRHGHHRLYLPNILITKLTNVRPHTVLAQIHNGDDDVTALRAEGVKTTDGTPMSKAKLWLTKGDTTHACYLGEKRIAVDMFSFGFDVFDGRVHFDFAGHRSPFTVAATADCYYKFGVYLQSNRDTAPSETVKAFTEARFYYPPQVSHAA